MKVLVTRAVPLKKETREAWKDAALETDIELRFAKHNGQQKERIERIFEQYGYDILLNLGLNTLEANYFPDGALYNDAELVSWMNSPKALRLSPLNIALPPTPQPDDNGMFHKVWAKQKGFGGRGKQFYKQLSATNRILNNATLDLQQHIEGQEYRVVTVGDKIVQANLRFTDENGERVYRWVGVKGLPKPVFFTVKYLVRMLPDRDHNVVGWDMVADEEDNVYMFEGNSCPGVNKETAKRILQAVESNFRSERLKEQVVRRRPRFTINDFTLTPDNNAETAVTRTRPAVTFTA